MAYSTQRAVSNGTMTYLDLSIGYQSRDDIKVFFNDLPAASGSWAWVGTTDKRISFTSVVPNGTEVLVQRSTRLDRIINVFALGAKFNNTTMDQNFLQVLYLTQEAVEGAALSDIYNDVDFHNYKIKNLGLATDRTDAITFGQVQDMVPGVWTAREQAIAAQAAAEAARDKAKQWATQLMTPVEGTDLSAKQYALNAKGSQDAAAASATASDSSATASQASRLASEAARDRSESARDRAEAAAAPATELIARVDNAVIVANTAKDTADATYSQLMQRPDRNGFVDGAFDTWLSYQSDSYGATPNYWTTTLWGMGAGTGGAANCKRADPRTGGQPRIGSKWCLQINQTTASTGTFAARTLPLLYQRLEGVHKYAGRTVTLSFDLWTLSGTMTIPGVWGRQYFGASGSTRVDFDKEVAWLVTSTARRFSVRVDVPSITGKIMGNDGLDNLLLGLCMPAGWTGTLFVAQAQVEESDPTLASTDITGNGGLPTPFAYLGEALEQTRVERFYFNGFRDGYYVGQAGTPAMIQAYAGPNAGAYQTLVSMAWPVRMVSSPNAISWSPSTGASYAAYRNNNGADVSVTATTVSPAGGSFSVNGVTLDSEGVQLIVTADARYPA